MTVNLNRLEFPSVPIQSLMQNDADTTYLIKNAYVLLSKPRSYWDGIATCLKMGDGKRKHNISFSPRFGCGLITTLTSQTIFPFTSLGGYIYIRGTSGGNQLVELLNNNSPAQAETSAFSQFWVYNGRSYEPAHIAGKMTGWSAAV